MGWSKIKPRTKLTDPTMKDPLTIKAPMVPSYIGGTKPRGTGTCMCMNDVTIVKNGHQIHEARPAKNERIPKVHMTNLTTTNQVIFILNTNAWTFSRTNWCCYRLLVVDVVVVVGRQSCNCVANCLLSFFSSFGKSVLPSVRRKGNATTTSR